MLPTRQSRYRRAAAARDLRRFQISRLIIVAEQSAAGGRLAIAHLAYAL